MSLAVDASSEEASLVLLERKITQLRARFEQLKTEAKALRKEYGRKFSKSLGGALAGFLALCEGVHEADKQLVFWYENGTLRKMLLYLGVNKKPSAIVKCKTKKLKAQAAVVESRFSSTGRLCKASLLEVQTLNRRVNDYNKSGIGSAQEAASELTADFGAKAGRFTVQIREKETECTRVSAGIEDTSAGLERTQLAKEQAEVSRDNAKTVSRCSFGGAIGLGLAALVFPPATGFAVGAMMVSGGTAFAASEMDNEARNLEKAQEQLSCQLSNLQSEIAELRSQMPALQTQQSRYTGLIASVAALGRECARMRRRTNQLSDCLLKDRKLLTQARMKMDRIAADLRSTKYAKTRREISFHLLEILQDLRQLHDSKDKKATKVQALSQAGNVIQRIKKRTPEMLKILEKPR